MVFFKDVTNISFQLFSEYIYKLESIMKGKRIHLSQQGYYSIAVQFGRL